MQYTYIAIDGDDVGSRLELYMLTNKLDLLAIFSKLFENTFQWLKNTLVCELEAKIIFSGGDNLLAMTNNDINLAEKLESIRKDFLVQAGRSISIGVGKTTRDAYFALKLAKASGKNCVYHLGVDNDG